MKLKKMPFLILIILIIFSLFVSAVYADYSGYFFKGFADGFNKGLQMGTKIKQKKEMRWKQEQIEELEKIFEQWEFFSDTVQNLIESKQMSTDLGKKFLLLNSLLPMDLQEHGQNFFNSIVSVDKEKVTEEKQYFKNIINTISLTGKQIDLKTFDNLFDLLSNDKKSLINIVIESGFLFSTPQSELKYNTFEDKWEYTSPDSKLNYNVFENKWEFAEPNEKPKFNPFEKKWEFASLEDEVKYNPFEDKWSYENPNNNLKYNPFQNKWEYTHSNSVLKYNPFEDSWSYK